MVQALGGETPVKDIAERTQGLDEDEQDGSRPDDHGDYWLEENLEMP